MAPRPLAAAAIVAAHLLTAACPYTEPPPPHFDRAPSVPVHEYPLPLHGIRRACEALFRAQFHSNTTGCGTRVTDMRVFPPQRYGVIVYLEGCDEIRRHEMAHVNGWAH